MTHFPFWGGLVSSQSSSSQPRLFHQHLVAGSVSNPILQCSPPHPRPHPGPNCPRKRSAAGWRGRCPPRNRVGASPPPSLGACRASLRDSLSLAVSLFPAPSLFQPHQKYIVFSPNPVQLQHNKTHNKNLIHFSPAPPISRHLLARD